MVDDGERIVHYSVRGGQVDLIHFVRMSQVGNQVGQFVQSGLELGYIRDGLAVGLIFDILDTVVDVFDFCNGINGLLCSQHFDYAHATKSSFILHASNFSGIGRMHRKLF